VTQTQRVLAYLRSNPGASSLEITMATGCVNVTGRISDIRKTGVEVKCYRGADKRDRYIVVEAAQLALAL